MNLTDTFADSISNMRIFHHSQLINSGVSRKVLFGGASLIGLSRIVPQKDGHFTFSDSGKPYFITPVGKLGEKNICWLDIRDLIAWRPTEETFYQYKKTETVLMTSPLYWREAFTIYPSLMDWFIYPSVMDWFKHDCNGIVVLDWRKFYPTKKGHDESKTPRPFNNTESQNYDKQYRKAS
jgi:hypothetical protein